MTHDLGLKPSIQTFDAFVKIHADGKSTLASISKWNSGKVNCGHFESPMDNSYNMMTCTNTQIVATFSHSFRNNKQLGSEIIFQVFGHDCKTHEKHFVSNLNAFHQVVLDALV